MKKELKENIQDELRQFIVKCLKVHGPWAVTEELSIFPHATCITKQGVVLGANDSFVSLCGYSKNELEGMHALELTNSDDHHLLMQVFANNRKDKYPLRLKTKSGESKHALVFPYVLDLDGEVYRFAEFIDLTETVEAQKHLVRVLTETTTALSYTIEKKDPYTVGHMNRTGAIAKKIATAMGLYDENISNLILGAKIHDIGKIAIPHEILIKPSKLDDLDWQYIKRHPMIGYEIISDLEIDPLIKDIVKYHHEYYDGSGYPDGKNGKAISTEVNIITIADSLDAIAGIRPYKTSKTFNEAIEIMESCNNRYNPDIFELAKSLVHDRVIADTEYFG